MLAPVAPQQIVFSFRWASLTLTNLHWYCVRGGGGGDVARIHVTFPSLLGWLGWDKRPSARFIHLTVEGCKVSLPLHRLASLAASKPRGGAGGPDALKGARLAAVDRVLGGAASSPEPLKKRALRWLILWTLPFLSRLVGVSLRRLVLTMELADAPAQAERGATAASAAPRDRDRGGEGGSCDERAVVRLESLDLAPLFDAQLAASLRGEDAGRRAAAALGLTVKGFSLDLARGAAAALPVVRRWASHTAVRWFVTPRTRSQPMGEVAADVAASALVLNIEPRALDCLARVSRALATAARSGRFWHMRPLEAVTDRPQLWWQFAIEAVKKERRRLLCCGRHAAGGLHLEVHCGRGGGGKRGRDTEDGRPLKPHCPR